MAFLSSQGTIQHWSDLGNCVKCQLWCRWIGQMNKSKVLFWVKKVLVCAYAWNLIRTTTRLDIICIWSNFHLTIQWSSGHFTSRRVHPWSVRAGEQKLSNKGSMHYRFRFITFIIVLSAFQKHNKKCRREISSWRNLDQISFNNCTFHRSMTGERENLEILGKSLKHCECWNQESYSTFAN